MAGRRKYYKKRRRGTNPQDTLFLIGGLVLVVGGLLTAYQAELSDAMWYVVVGLLILLPIAGGCYMVLRLARLKRKEDSYFEHKAIDTLLFMDPFEFERFIGWVFSRQGYSVTVTRERGDHGLDVQMVKDRTFYAAQVKRYKKSHTVSEPEVRDFYGSFRDDAAHGFFVTTSDFTAQARLWAKDKPIDLVTGEDLVHMIKDFEGSGWYDLLLNKVFLKV